MTNLTQKQKKVLDFITSYFKENRKTPAIAEIRAFMNVKSSRSVTQFLEVLERNGFIYRDKYARRGIRIISQKSNLNSDIIKIPLYGSAGCDNQTVLAEPIYDEYISISKKLIESKDNEVFAIKTIGDSMTEAGIENGDTVLAEKTQNVKNGDRVVVVIDDIAVIKRIMFGKNSIILNPDSKDESYKPIVMNKDFEVYGKVIEVIKKKKPGDDIELIQEPY